MGTDCLQHIPNLASPTQEHISLRQFPDDLFRPVLLPLYPLPPLTQILALRLDLFQGGRSSPEGWVKAIRAAPASSDFSPFRGPYEVARTSRTRPRSRNVISRRKDRPTLCPYLPPCPDLLVA